MENVEESGSEYDKQDSEDSVEEFFCAGHSEWWVFVSGIWRHDEMRTQKTELLAP